MTSLRRAVPADAPPVATLVQDAYAPYVERIGRPPAPMLDDYAQVVGTQEVWVAVAGEAIIGCLVLVTSNDHLLLDNIAVKPAAQGRGVGAQLLAQADRRARELGLCEIRLYTNAAMTQNHSYYARHGYVETHRGNEHGYERVYFSRRLVRDG